MSLCAEDIKENLGVNICDEPLARGVGEVVFMGRFAWLAGHAPDATNKKIIRTISLKAGKKLLRYMGQNFSNGISSNLATSENGNTWVQALRYILFSNDPDDEAELDKLAILKDVFAIVKKNGNPGSYKIVGWKTGLRMVSASSDSNDESLKGAYAIEMQAPDEKTTYYTLQHMSADQVPVDDTDTYLDTLAKPLD